MNVFGLHTTLKLPCYYGFPKMFPYANHHQQTSTFNLRTTEIHWQNLRNVSWIRPRLNMGLRYLLDCTFVLLRLTLVFSTSVPPDKSIWEVIVISSNLMYVLLASRFLKFVSLLYWIVQVRLYIFFTLLSTLTTFVGRVKQGFSPKRKKTKNKKANYSVYLLTVQIKSIKKFLLKRYVYIF